MITMDQIYRPIMDERLKQAGEWQYMRYPHPWHNPAFKSAPAAAQRLLEAYPHFRIATLRDQSLRPLRELILEQDRVLIVPAQSGDTLYRIPRSALYPPSGIRAGALRISPMPAEAEPFTGPVDAIVVGCLGFSPEHRCIYDLDFGRSKRTVGHIQVTHAPSGADGQHIGIPVIALAADCQEVDWPEEARSYVAVDVVVTQTRVINIGGFKWHSC